MRRRITLAIVTVTALAVALFGIPLAVVIHHLYVTDARTKLEREATLAARDVPTDFATVRDPIDLPTSRPGITVGLYAPDGRRLSGQGPESADRPVTEALANRVGDREVGDRLIAAIPVTLNENVVAVVRAETSIHPAEHRAHLAWALMVLLGVVAVGFAGGLGAAQANRLTRPLRRLRDSAAQLGLGDFAISVPPAGVTELDDLADALTTTASRLGQAMEREQAFSSHASHQLRTPIAGLRLAIETELANPRPDPALALGECLSVTDRLETTVTDLLRLAREPSRPERVDLAAIVAAAENRWHGSLAASGRRLHVETAADLPLASASEAAITHALDVLVDNAMRHGRGEVTIRAEAADRGVVVTVTDGGDGMVSGASEDRGIGEGGRGGRRIGLGLARTLVEAQGGRIRVPEPGTGSTFAIVLRVASGTV